LKDDNPHVPRVSIERLMDTVDWSHRWVYKGSRTVPPCDQYVYWNVIQKIYPIKADQVANFKAKLAKIGVDVTG